MREPFEELLADLSLVRLALAIAIGWSLYQVGHGLAVFVDGLATRIPAGEPSGGVAGFGLSWVVGRHIVHLDDLVIGVIELAVAVAIALWLRHREPAGTEQRASPRTH